jgi:uncharacterized membrane protein
MAATRPDLRVGDAERESTATALREHYAQGRLSTDELNERLDAAFSATTHGQLELVTDDLPHIQPAPPAPRPPAVPPRRAGAAVARAVAALVTVVALLAVVTVALHGGAHVPRNIITLVIALLILRGLVGRAFGHQHRVHHHQRWDHHAAVQGSEDDGDDDRFDRFDQSRHQRHEHHHEHHRSRTGHGYRYSYRYEYDYEHPRDSR